jgi:uncharacterized protein Yka (UPF0111/DUF47 family)
MWPAKRQPDRELLELFEESGRNGQRAALLLREMLVDFPERSGLAQEIVLCEHEGDRITHDILYRLAECDGRRAAFDSADIHALAAALDDVVDYSEEVADYLGLYQIEAPMEQAQAIADVLVSATDEVAAALRTLRSGADPAGRLVEIHRLENEGDTLVRSAVASLFVDGIDPMVVIRWKDIFETLERAVDSCEAVANVLEGMGLKRR